MEVIRLVLGFICALTGGTILCLAALILAMANWYRIEDVRHGRLLLKEYLDGNCLPTTAVFAVALFASLVFFGAYQTCVAVGAIVLVAIIVFLAVASFAFRGMDAREIFGTPEAY